MLPPKRTCFGDLNAGKQPHLVRPAPRSKRGGSHVATDHVMRQVAACAAVDVLSKGKAGPDRTRQAEQEVAQLTAIPVGALSSWRKALKTGRKGKQARSAFAEMRRHLLEQSSPVKAARDTLRKINWHKH
jgi:hypothetical protein